MDRGELSLSQTYTVYHCPWTGTRFSQSHKSAGITSSHA